MLQDIENLRFDRAQITIAAEFAPIRIDGEILEQKQYVKPSDAGPAMSSCRPDAAQSYQNQSGLHTKSKLSPRGLQARHPPLWYPR
jgi:hypothetical protein